MVAATSWLLFAGSTIYLMYIRSYELNVDYSDFFPQLFFSLFVLATFFYYRYKITKADSLNFTDLLWKVFITGLVTTLLSLGIQGFFVLFSNSSVIDSPLIINLFYIVLSGLVNVFSVSTFVVWKRLILYQKSKNLLQLWGFFEIVLCAALVFDFFGSTPDDAYFSIAILIIVLFSSILVFNLKWVAYLNFRQKWKGILFILLSGIYLSHFLRILNWFSETDILVINMLNQVFVLGLFGFLFAYAAISILVTLFNLPTSSVFEQKLKEAIDFQKLSQSVPHGETTDQTYETLIDSAMSAVFADAAWLEINNDYEKRQVIRNLSDTQVDQIKNQIESTPFQDILNLSFKRDTNSGRFSGALKQTNYRSIMALPIWVQDRQIGFIVLLNEVSDAFNREMVGIVTTFVNQASVSLENLTLIKESLENERFKEQLKIAKNVQKSLLPPSLVESSGIKMEAFSVSADEVGGDYYDYLEYAENKFGIIIGDVSGKGTSAAFQMAQMKGIFHSLVREGISPRDFIIKMNMALSKCLDKSSFITTTYFDINTERNTFSFSRAGHCPGLMYCAKNNNVEFLQSDGMGLGILRNSSYNKYVVESTVHYSKGDTLLLYTDGIIEAKNKKGALFGDERLKASFEKYCTEKPNRIKEGIQNDLADFIGDFEIDDDYSLMIIQFKKQ